MREWTERARGGELEEGEVWEVVERLVSVGEDGEAKAEFLVALHERGETPGEIASFVEALLARAEKPEGILGGGLLDVCGTGGDKAGFFNVSTAVMFVVAACGVRVVKHGNRGITSKSGGADVLESLGVPIRVRKEEAGEFLARHGFVFLFAPDYHPAFREIGPVRKRLAERGKTTIFNVLGPLLNPVSPEFQMAGVFQEGLLPVYGEVLRILGRKEAWAVHGRVREGGLDEFSLHGVTDVVRVAGGRTEASVIDGREFGLVGSDEQGLRELRGGGPEENAEILRAVLGGEERGARRSIVVLNAGAALCVCGQVRDLAEGIEAAGAVIDGGKTKEMLHVFGG